MDFYWDLTEDERQEFDELYEYVLTLPEGDLQEMFLNALGTGTMHVDGGFPKKIIFEDDGSMGDILYPYDVLDSYIESINRLLTLEVKERADRALELRNRIQAKFKKGAKHIEADLFTALEKKHSPVADKPKVRRRRSVRFESISRTHYLHDGLTAKASVCMTYGSSDAGKTAHEIAKCIAVVEGSPCFDRDHPAEQGNVLFIATDSGFNDFLATLEKLGFSDHQSLKNAVLEPGDPEFKPDLPSFFVWAESPADGIERWTATPAKVDQLIDFVKNNNVKYVVIDSVKTILGFDQPYTDNQVAAQFIVMLKNAVCLPTGCCITLINHDGVQDNANAGAKAWKENVTMVTRLEAVFDNARNRVASKAYIDKDRVNGQHRSFAYGIDKESGRFKLMPEVEIVGRCEEAIARILFELHLEGKPQGKAKTIIERAASRGIPEKTVRNTLSLCYEGEFFGRKSIGVYRLTEKQLEAFQQERSG